jgi:hypothetical protein
MKATQQMLAFQKQYLDTFQSFWEFAQNQTAGTVNQIMDQAPWVPSQGRQAVEKWLTLMSQERERYAAHVDRGFAIYEKMFTEPKAAAALKTKTQKIDAEK